jgi:hypothetical protein
MIPPADLGMMPSRSILAPRAPIWRRLDVPRQLGAAFVAALVAAGCATYPERTAAAFADFQRGQLSQALSAYEKPQTTGAPFLAFAESGMVAMTAGDWDKAIQQLSKATELSKDYEDRALIDLESVRDTILSWTINESQETYHGEGYERVMIHACLAMAYLAKGQLTAAQVETRRANTLLESEEKLYDKSYRAGGLGHLLSAVAYELDRKKDDAYIDYERMVEKGVGEGLAGRALVRLARETGRKDDLENWTERFGDAEPVPKDAAQVFVIAGVGTGPFKRETTLPIPAPEGLLQWSIPNYERRPQPVTSVVLEVRGGDKSVRTVVIEDVNAVATENLSDRILWLAGKSAVRAILKYELTRKLEKEAGGLGTLAGILFTFVTERADLRAWQTLPDTWQAAHVYLPAGVHPLALVAEGGERVQLGTFELEAGETMFVFARTIETRVFAHPIGGKRTDAQLAPETQTEATKP